MKQFRYIIGGFLVLCILWLYQLFLPNAMSSPHVNQHGFTAVIVATGLYLAITQTDWFRNLDKKSQKAEDKDNNSDK